MRIICDKVKCSADLGFRDSQCCVVYYCCNLCVDSVEELGRVVILAASCEGTTVYSVGNSPGSGVE